MIIKVSTDVTGEDAYMLNVFYGDMPNVIYNTAVYFKNTYAEEWITAPLTREMIQDVDHSTVLDSGVIDSPVLGKIPPVQLSGGVKTLILIANEPEKVFNASTCGDNCAKWLLKIAESGCYHQPSASHGFWKWNIYYPHPEHQSDRSLHAGTCPRCRTLCVRIFYDRSISGRCTKPKNQVRF